MNLHDLLSNLPKLHQDGSNTLVSWKASDEVLSFIDQSVDENSKSLETGAGVSTILFALKGTNHTCIVPDKNQVELILDYCKRNSISTEKCNFQIEMSEKILPKLEVDELDIVLIDGRHAFPTPFIDWYYTSSMLKVGGILIVDDTQLTTGDILKKFLLLESEWKLKEDFLKASAFLKIREGSHSKEWDHQPYIARNSSNLVKLYEMRRAVQFLRNGELGKLVSKGRESFGV